MFKNKEEQFDFYWKEIFTGLAYNPIEFNTYRFDQTMSLPGKVNKLYELFKVLAMNNQEVMDYLKVFVETFDFKIETTLKDILDFWFNDGKLTEIIRLAINEEVIEARESETVTYESLKDRLDTENKNLNLKVDSLQEEMTGNTNQLIDTIKKILDSLDNDKMRVLNGRFKQKIRPIFDNPINTLDSKIRTLDSESFNFAFITDTHYQQGGTYWSEAGKVGQTETSLSHLNNVGYFSDTLSMVMCGGDNIDDSTPFSKEKAYNANNQFVSQALSVIQSPVFFGIGNHDDNNIVSVYNQTEPFKSKNKTQRDIVLNQEDFELLYHQKEPLFDEVRNNASNYFYKDFDSNKIRFIWVDVYDNGYDLEGDKLKYPRNKYSIISDNQIQWLANIAFKVPKDYTILIGTHCPLNDVFMPNGNTCINHDVLLNLLLAFKQQKPFVFKGVSYTFESNLIAGVFSGHYHDDMHKKWNNIPFTVADCSMGGAKETKYFNTPLEDSWKYISVNQKIKVVNVFSFGRGEDYNYTY